MDQEKPENNTNIPIVKHIIKWSRGFKIPGLQGLTLYSLVELYGTGIIKGSFSPRASAIAYSFFVALFPFLLFILNLIPYINIEGFQTRFLIFIEEALPAQTSDLFYPVIADIAVNPRGGLLSFVIILALFLAANGVNATFSAFENSYHVTLNRGFLSQYIVAFVVSLLLALLLLITVVVIVYGEFLINDLTGRDYIKDDLFWISLLQITVFVVMVYVAVSTLYYFGTKELRKTRFFSLGAFITTLLFIVTTYLFGIYIENFSTYNELYGSLGALLIMMLYIWINSNLLLLGFELNIALYKLDLKQTRIKQ